MTYEEVSKEYLEIHSECIRFKHKIIKEIGKLYDTYCGINKCRGKAVCFDKLKHGIEGPTSYFRLIKRNGVLSVSSSIHCDDISTNLEVINLKGLKFIYEVLYHEFCDVTD